MSQLGKVPAILLDGTARPLVNTPDGASVRVISGEVAGVRGSVRDIVTDPDFVDMSLPPGKSFRHQNKEGHTVFAFL